jgi:hypothetical protein
MHKPNSIFEAASTILFGEAVDLSDEDLKVINDLKKSFPPGSTINKWSGSLEWSKSGGYAGEKSLATAREKLEKLGFKYSDAKLLGLPDGSTSGFNTVLANKKLGWYVTFIQFYGQTASSNRYSITLKKLPTNEAYKGDHVNTGVMYDGKGVKIGVTYQRKVKIGTHWSDDQDVKVIKIDRNIVVFKKVALPGKMEYQPERQPIEDFEDSLLTS